MISLVLQGVGLVLLVMLSYDLGKRRMYMMIKTEVIDGLYDELTKLQEERELPDDLVIGI